MWRRICVVGVVVASLPVVNPVLVCANEGSPNAAARVKGLMAEGLQREQEKRYPEAIHAYKHALEYDPAQIEALARLGFCYRQLRQYRNAIAAYRKAVLLNGDATDIRWQLGTVYVEAGSLELAQRETQQLAKRDPQRATTLNALITAKREQRSHASPSGP